MLRTRLFWKTFLGYVALILGTTLILGWVISDRVSDRLVLEFEQGLRDKALLLAEISRPALDLDRTADLAGQANRLGQATRTRYTVIAADGRVLADSHRDPGLMDEHATRPEVLRAKTHGEGTATRFSETLQSDMLYYAVAIDNGDRRVGYVRTALPLVDVEAELAAVRTRLLTGALLASLPALFLGFVASRRVVAPLLALTRAAEAVARGEHEHRVDWDSGDEIGDLARSFNAMNGAARNRMETITRDRNKLATILAGMVEGVIAVDDSERILHINHAAARMLNIPESAEGTHVWQLHDGHKVAELVSACLERETVLTEEVRLMDASGERWIELFASPLRDGEGRLRGSAVVLHDVTRLRRLESVRRDFVANASHELKTPITAIIGLVETLLTDEDMPADIRTRFLGKIQTQSQRLSALVQDLILLSRVEGGDKEETRRPVDFAVEVREARMALTQAAEAKRVRLEAVVPETPALVVATSRELRDVVDNLLDNAIKYSGEGGVVQVRLSEHAGQVILEVEDKGIGIAPEHQDRVFERFYRVDPARSRDLGGTGLGLSIVRNIAQSLGGSVALESVLGQGSVFRFSAPQAVSSWPSQG